MYHRGRRLGGGTFGEVYESISPDGHPVAVKTYPVDADGDFALRAIDDAAPLLRVLCDRGVTVPLFVQSASPTTLVMPVCTRPPDSWWPLVFPLAESLIASGAVMSDIKPANLGVFNGSLLLLDVESVSRPSGKFTALGSYPLITVADWGGPELSANREIASRLAIDPAANRALTRHAALCTALTMHSKAMVLNWPAVARLDNTDANAAWQLLAKDLDASPLIAAARERGACAL